MDDILTALDQQHRELRSLLAGLDASGWRASTPCEGWDVTDVVLHLAQTDELAVASATGRFDEALEVLGRGLTGIGSVDDGAAALVARDRAELDDAEVLERWERGTRRLVEVLRGVDPHRRVTWVAGQLTTRTLATTRLAEAWIHTTDVAAALGVALRPTDRLRHVARLAWRTLPYAFSRAGRSLAGPVVFELRGPDGDVWSFLPDEPAATTVRGDALDLCLVAGRRLDPSAAGLRAEGPDADAVLALVRTYA